jgi:hypothetical protein
MKAIARKPERKLSGGLGKLRLGMSVCAQEGRSRRE